MNMNPLGQNRPGKSISDVQKVHSEKPNFWRVLKTLKKRRFEQTEINMNPLGQNRPDKSMFEVQTAHS